MKKVKCVNRDKCDGIAERTNRKTQDGGTIFYCSKCGSERVLYEDFLVDVFSIPVQKKGRRAR
jgi:hypothetical protein